MIYIIDNKVIFDSDDGALIYIETQDIISLPLPACRLLEVLITSEGRELTRDNLLEHVWDKHGLQSSGNSLNQYISILRRNLATFECKDLIITLPKIGFKINTAIRVQVTRETEDTFKAEPVPPVVYSVARGGKKTLTGLLVLLLLIVLVSIIWLHFKSTKKNAGLSAQNKICEMIFLDYISEKNKTEAMLEAKNILKSNGLTCGKGQVLIFNKEQSSISESNSRVFLSLCTKENNNKFSSCENFYNFTLVKP
ncbi:winged helix-turn-helix domain-containing protein [Ewingella sp. S1.OA.A_B6]